MSNSISTKPSKYCSGDFNLQSMQVINNENHKQECLLDESIYNTPITVVINETKDDCLVDVYLNCQNLFQFNIFMGSRLLILIGYMIFKLPLWDVIMMPMSTVSFLEKLVCAFFT